MTQDDIDRHSSDRAVSDDDEDPSNTITPIKEPGRRNNEKERPWRDPETDPADQPDPIRPEPDDDDDTADDDDDESPGSDRPYD
jgi:hypothetical protein